MKKLKKRLLALLLASAMVFSGSITTLAKEDITESPAATSETGSGQGEEAAEAGKTEDAADVSGQQADNENVDTSQVSKTEEAKTKSSEPSAQADEPSAQNVSAAALTIGTKPENGTTTGQPFTSGTGGSTNFRIPALATLSDGTLVAAADARWNHTSDGYGLDTIVSYSANNGSTWNYTFANYLGDNGNAYNSDSTAFIDPALAVTSNDTIYMLVDLYPHGTYIGNVKAGTGFDTNGHLLLSADNGKSFGYYVGDFTNEKASIYTTSGDVVSGYTVDVHYNIKSTDGTTDTNLFFSDSPYQVLSTSYLYLTKSTDKGQTWSAPMMLNSQVKNSSDKFYGVGPGRGLVTSTGRIIFPCYTNADSRDGNTSVIYSDDSGNTWKRSSDMSAQSSEAALAEADGKVYMFTRHGGYYVSSDNGSTWGTQQTVSGISYTTSCQLSAITYSKKIDGKTAILLSAPTSGRAAGKIFVGLVQDNGSINWKYTYSVNGSNYYAYSCLTELKNGSIGLLYENGSASITYTNLAIADIAEGAQIGTDNTGNTGNTDEENEEDVQNTEDVTVYVGQSKTVTDSTGNYENSYTGSGLNTSIANVSVKGNTVAGGEKKVLGSTVSMNSNGSYTGVISDGTNYLVLNNGALSSTTDINQATEWTVTRSTSWGQVSYTIQSGSYYLSNSNNQVSVSKSETSWKYNNGFYYTTGFIPTTTYYLRTNNGTWQVSTSSSNNGQLYSVETQTTEAVDATDIIITGVAVGETSVVVGNTRYHITVQEAPENLDTDTTPFVANTGVGKSKAVTKLTTSVGLTFGLDLNISGSNVVWSIGDPSIATVDQSGKVTGVKAGETTVTATVDGVAYTIPVVIRQDTTSSSVKIYDFYLSEVTDTVPYYSVSMSTDLVEAQEGEAIYISCGASDNTAVDFFAKPADGYALTRMSSTNSAGDYMALNSDTPSETDFCTKSGAAGANQSSTFGSSAVYAMVQAALDKECDGGMGWTRPSSNTSGVTSDLTFRSEKLPTVSKSVASVDGKAYTEGMTAHKGEKVVFNVTVTQYAAQDTITYSNASLKDNLSGATFANSKNATQTVTGLSNTALSTNKEITYQVEYTITDADLDKTIVNTVDLTYTYKSQYSSGSFGGTANANAKLTAASFAPEDIVIDFGLPVTLDFSGEDAHGRYNLSSGTATYGIVTVDANKVTYTPNKVLTEADAVTLTNTEGGEYTFKVYPATSVYYEEGFASYTGSWSGTNKGKDTQTASKVGAGADEVYGYDAHYASATENSDGTTSGAGSTGATAEFTFSGTGCDVYALTANTSGAMSMWLYDMTGVADNGSGTLLKLGYVDTCQKWISESDGNSYYNTPVFSYKDLDASKTYKVVMKVTSGDVTLDGFRVYNTKGTAYDSVYTKDKENGAGVVEVRDVAIAGANVSLASVDDWYTYGENIIKAVYDETNNGSGAIILSADSSGGNITVDADMVNNGPKNEIYLQKGQTLALKVDGNAAKTALGIRSLNGGDISYKINGTEGNLTSTVDMYHPVTLNEGMLVVTNTGDNVIALTKLKATQFAPNTAAASLAESITADAELVTFALRCMAGKAEPELAEAVASINVVDYKGKTLATAELSQTGEKGSEGIFTADAVKAAAKEVLPNGYALVDETAIQDVAAVYGESTEITVQAGKVATLKVTYKNLLGKKIGTVTLTGVQTSSASKHSFSAAELRKAAPSGYWTGTLISEKVKYGETKTRTVYGL